MSSRQFHTLEKLVVQLTSLAALAVVYFFIYPAVRVDDGQSAIAFIPTGSFPQAAAFVAMILALAAACALLTVSARPEGTLLAVFIAAGGISLHSPRFATLLWIRDDGYAGLFHTLILEMLVMAALLAIVILVVKIIRSTVGRIKPEWIWKSPLQDTPAGQGAAGGKLSRQMLIGRSAVSMCLGLLTSVVLLLVIMQSSQRGQVLFSLLVSFTLAVLIAQKLMPSPYSEVFFAMPIIVGMFFYALASVASVGESVQDWINVPHYARVLPIDWLTAGCGGAAIGYWICQRVNESAYFESQELAEGK
jgi:hypothetical protein